MGYMNINAFGQMLTGEDGKEIRRLWFTHYEKFRGKDRFVALGRYKDNLTLPKTLELIGLAEKKAAVGTSNNASKAGTPIKRAPANKRRLAKV